MAGRGQDRGRVAVMIGFGLYLLGLAAAAWASVQWLPDRLAFTLMGHPVLVGELHRRLLTKGLVLALIVPAVFAAEMACVGWSDSSLRQLVVRRTPSSRTDLSCFIIWQTPVMTALTAVMTFGLALLSGAWLHNRLCEITGMSWSIASAPVLFQFVIVFMVYTFFDYWNHRIDHSPYFWPLHRYHHAADDFTVLNSARTHPASFTGVIGATLPAALLCAKPSVVIDINLFVMALRYVIHSRINSDFGWVGRYLIQSPLHHRRHHGLEQSESGSHFSLVPLWDHLFGTWRGDTDPSRAIGVTDPYRHGAWLAPDLWRDYRAFWEGLGRAAVSSMSRRCPAKAPGVGP